VAYPLPADPTPSGIESLVERLPAAARAELEWFPNATRQLLTPLRDAPPEQVPALVDELAVPYLQLLSRLGRSTASLLAKPELGEIVAPLGSSGAMDARALDPVDDRLSPSAAAALRDAYAWSRAIIDALLIDFRTQTSLRVVVDSEEPSAEDIQEELDGPSGAMVRGMLLTIAALEAVLDDRALPSTIELWCRLASLETQAAANGLRARGLAVPTAVSAPVLRNGGSVVSLVRNDVLPPGVEERLLAELRPDAIWLFGSRARGTHGPNSDWDLLVVVPDDVDLDDAELRPGLAEVRRQRVEVFLIGRSDFEEARSRLGTLAHLAATQGYPVHGA